MSDEKLPMVIAIAAVSGGGKTTIVKQLNERLDHSKAIFFDDYDVDGPDNIVKWVDEGANYNEWNVDPLINDVVKLLTSPINYIFLDYPFAYKQEEMSKFIDLAVFIDTPLDIAMARRINRDFKNSSVNHILMEMNNYLSNGRRGYLEMLETIKPNSDIIVDGTLNKNEIVRIILEKLK